MASFKRDKKRILFVDDHEDTLEMVALQLTGYEIISARDFAEGLLLAHQRYFDLYILDSWLPDGTGVELCRHIREFDPHTPILFYSGLAAERNAQAGLNAGAQAYLTKPVDSDELYLVIAQAVFAVGERAIEARRAEYAAIQEELVIRQTGNVRRVEAAKGKFLRAEAKALRVKAELAFLEAGGTRGDFARQWTSLFQEEVRGRVGGNH